MRLTVGTPIPRPESRTGKIYHIEDIAVELYAVPQNSR